MIPAEHHDGPGLSSMGMKTIPRYADDGAVGGGGGVRIDAAATQNLGVRLATVERGVLQSDLTVTGTIDFNQRSVAVVQARAPGFVQRVYNRAPASHRRRSARLRHSPRVSNMVEATLGPLRVKIVDHKIMTSRTCLRMVGPKMGMIVG